MLILDILLQSIFILLILLLIITLISMIYVLIGMPKPVKTEYKTVDVIITDLHYKDSYLQSIPAGKVNIPIFHSAEYSILVEYNGNEYEVYGKETYDSFKKKIGQTTKGTLQIDTYKNGAIKYNIIKLEDMF